MKDNNKKGFTLVEIVIVMAMISILAAALIVSISSQRKNAQASRALAELSAVIQPILMCLSDGGTINSPNGSGGGTAICNIGGADNANYGRWPQVNGGALPDIGNYSSSDSASFLNGVWYFSNSVSGGPADLKICCNAASSRCALEIITTCNNSTDLTQY